MLSSQHISKLSVVLLALTSSALFLLPGPGSAESTDQPQIEEVRVIDVGPTSALVYVAANGSISIQYGTAPDVLDQTIPLALDLTVLENLLPENKYYFTATASAGGQTETSNVQSFTTSANPVIESVNPKSTSDGTLITITGKHFGKGPDQIAPGTGNYIVSVGCDTCLATKLEQDSFITCKPDLRCFTDLVSWSDTKIVAKITSRSKTGNVYIGKALVTHVPCSPASKCPPSRRPDLFFIVKGPVVTVTEATTEPEPAVQLVTSLFSCSFSTTVRDSETLQVPTLFVVGSETDQYLRAVHDAYVAYWDREPRCDEMQFHLDHSTPLDRLTEWLKGQAITEKFDCTISTTMTGPDAIRVGAPLTLGNETDLYLTSVAQAYETAWGRAPRCDELQFHLDHATPLERLSTWLEEHEPGTEPTAIVEPQLPAKKTGGPVTAWLAGGLAVVLALGVVILRKRRII